MVRTRWVAAAAMIGWLLTAGGARAEGISWGSSVKDALTEAARDGRLVMIGFSDEDCTWCDRMDGETLASPEVIEMAKRFVPVRIEVDKTPEAAREYGIEGVPSFVFLEAPGDEVARMEGFMPAPAFVARLNEVLGEQERVAALVRQVAEKPQDYAAKADLARIYIERRNGDKAAPLVDALAALPRDSENVPKDMADLLLGTGIAYGSRGNNDRALVYLAKVSEGYPDTEEAEWAGFFTGLALGLKGEREAAIAQLEKMVATAKNEAIRERSRMLLERFREAPPVPSL
ncbi:MAG: thioredoxin family protein [Armatimonadetes bacterium]|nr:thioredoxin family protein [Armatimonadota bacterium]